MDSGTRFHSKMLKMENLLSIINIEADSAIKLLNYLKEHSFEMVEALKKIPSSSVFLKEFLEINSYLLKYLDFLTEINCKFEMLQTFEKEESVVLSSQNSTSAGAMEFKSNKSDLDVNFDDNSIIPPILPRNNISDHFIDPGNSNSTESSCAEKTPVGDKSKRAEKIQNKGFMTENKKKKDISNKKLLSTDGYSDDKQSVCEGVRQIHSQKPIGNEEVKNGHKNGQESSICSLTESDEEESLESSISDHCLDVKKSIDKNTISKAKILSLTEEISVSDILCSSSISESKRNVKVEAVKDSDLSLTKDYSLGLVSAEQLERCNDKLYEIRPVNISRRVGKEYKVIVEHIISPSEFYVYILQSHLHLFAELEKKLKLIQKDKNFPKKKESKEYFKEVMGKYALYYSKCDEKWCRAKITDWRVNHKDDLVFIFLLDYGESKCVILEDLQPMPDCLKLYPAFVHRCHLFGIYPTEVTLSSKTLAWSKAASEKMKCLVDASKNLKIKIGPEDNFHPAKSLPVTLWLFDQGDSCINDLLVKSQQAQFARKTGTVKDSISENERLEVWNPMKEDFDSYLNLYELDMKDPAAVIYGYVGKDYDRICKHFAKTGKCFKGQSCTKEHVPLNPLGFTTDKEEVYKNAVNALTLPPPKSVVNVQVTCILSLNVFCCIRDESAWTCEEETLASLVQYMNSNENIRDMKKLLIPPSVGQLVIAKYSQDSSWYRAKILESQPESDQYSVLFVDYGNKEVMPLACIRAIEGRYLHLPFQAMHCCIFGIAQNPEVPVKESMDYLNARMTEGHVSLEVVATFPGDHPRLLVHVLDQNGKNIGTDLIAKKYAVLKQELLVNSESTSIPG